ncbi:MAG: VTT domain-containing protein [Clostridia bacterium]|nr:VTT domain-containing protein [Clostridia bacterium]
MAETEQKKDYGKLVKVLQIVTGVFMLAMVAVGIYLIQKYNIKMSNIQNLAAMLTGGALTVGLIIIGVSIVKSFCLIFPPMVILSVCAYVMPNFWSALIVNIIALVLSLALPYLLGRFTGAGMVDTLKKRFKAVKKIDDFAGTNEVKMTAVVKFSGILPGDLSSLLFGALGISFKNYMIGSTLGNLPLILVYTLFGTLLKNVDKNPWVVSIPVVVIILFLAISGVITKKMISDNKKAQAESAPLTEE